MGKWLNKIFVFKKFPVRFRWCGKAGAYATSKGVLFCKEYAQKLYATLGDKKKATDAIIFTIFHEVGHILMAQWQYPFFDNEDVADEFATVALTMMGQKERVRSKAEYFASHPAAAEALAKAARDDRHSLSVQRARNIIRWVESPQLVRKWQKVLIPQMETTVLKRLQKKPTHWSVAELVNKELASRK